MNIVAINHATRVLGGCQGYLALPIRDEVVDCIVGGRVPSMVTEWKPDLEELAALMAGAPVQIRILGTQHPPIMVDVGERPNASETKAAPATA